MICSKCKTNHSDNQFVWNGACHKTYIKCKENCEQNKKQKNQIRIVNSVYINKIINQEETKQINNAIYVKVSYLEVEDFVEREIQELTDMNIDTIYQTHLLVHMDIATQYIM